MHPNVNFTIILLATFALIFFRQKITNTKINESKAVQNT